MIRILFFHYSNALGGAERSLLDILRGLPRERVTVELLTFGDGPLSQGARAAGVSVTSLPEKTDLSAFRRGRMFFSLVIGIARLPDLFRQMGLVRKAFREIKPDIIHTNNPKSHVMGALAAARLNTPMVFHMRDIFSPASFSLLLLRGTVALHEHKVVCISNAVREALPRGMRKQALVIHNGFTLPVITKGREKVRLELGMGYGEKIIVSAGRIVPWKGFSLLVSSMAPLLRGGGCRLIIMGDSIYWRKDYVDNVKAVAHELGVEEQVIFTGYMEKPENIFAASDVFVLPSRQEPFGRVAAEAMLCGIPVVAFNEAGPGEIVLHGKTGLLVEPGSEEALRDGVHALLSDGAVSLSMGSAAREDVQKRFPIRETLRKLESLYQEIMESHGTK